MDPVTTDVPPHTGLLAILGPDGFRKVYWDSADPATVAAAETAFQDHVGPLAMPGLPYAAFRLDGLSDISGGEQIRAFDPAATQILLIPPFVGG